MDFVYIRSVLKQLFTQFKVSTCIKQIRNEDDAISIPFETTVHTVLYFILIYLYPTIHKFSIDYSYEFCGSYIFCLITQTFFIYFVKVSVMGTYLKCDFTSQYFTSLYFTPKNFIHFNLFCITCRTFFILIHLNTVHGCPEK